jgi:hypothetical protein
MIMRNYQVSMGIVGLLAFVAGASTLTASCTDDAPVESGGSAGTGGGAGSAGSGPQAGAGGDTGGGGSDADPDAASPGAVDAGEVGDAAACPALTTVNVEADITASTTWTACNVYVLPEKVALFVKNNATLTIEPGTTVQGRNGSVLTITRGSKIMAQGTKEKPILLTTDQPVGMRTPGYWGGLLLLGNAPINNNQLSAPPSTSATFEAFTAGLAEGSFGGADPHDSSGVIKYMRIEFAGYNFVADREFNNFTLCGVGDGTIVDYVQLHAGSDDGIELFGGTVNVKHIVSSQNQDDGFDTDNGWQGKAQFVIVQNIDPHGATEASNGYESDNHGTAASYTAEPRTLPTVYNVTLLGLHDYAGGTSFATVLRRGTGGKYWNHIITGFPKGLEIRDQATADQVTAGNLFIKSSIIFNNGADGTNWPPPQASGDIDEKAIFENAEWSNRQLDPGLPAAAFSRTAPSFKPAQGSAAMSGASMPPTDGFFEPVTFVGAVGADDWTAGWTSYPQAAVQ